MACGWTSATSPAHQLQDGAARSSLAIGSGSSLRARDPFAKARRERRGPIEVAVVRPSSVDPADEPKGPTVSRPRQKRTDTSKPFDASCCRIGLLIAHQGDLGSAAGEEGERADASRGAGDR